MKLSTKGRYGVKAMFELALNYGKAPMSIKSISEKQHISECYLEQLFSLLRKANLVKSIRGAQGGYVLNKSPKEITAADIMDVLEGPIEVSECIDDKKCNNIDCCATRDLWIKIKESIDSVTKNVSLQDLLDNYKEKMANRSE